MPPEHNNQLEVLENRVKDLDEQLKTLRAYLGELERHMKQQR